MNDDDLLGPDPSAPSPVIPHPSTAAASSSSATPDTQSNHFPDVFAFVEEFLVHVYAREHTGSQNFRWCPRWHHHPEAMSRLQALWKAFEALRLDPGAGGSTWWNVHADPTVAALTDPEGPFRECDDVTHVAPPALRSLSAVRTASHN